MRGSEEPPMSSTVKLFGVDDKAICFDGKCFCLGWPLDLRSGETGVGPDLRWEVELLAIFTTWSWKWKVFF